MPDEANAEATGREHEVRLAHQLLSQETGVGRDVLYELLGRPKRYSELKPVLEEGKSENSLTVALKTLRRNGLVDRRTDARQAPPVHRYELTPLGIEVVLTMESLRPLEHHLSLLNSALGIGTSGVAGQVAGVADLVTDLPDSLQPHETTQGRSSGPEVWHVAPHPEGGWRVERQGSRRATRVLDTKKEALAFARELAKREEGRQVIVHKSDGSIQKQIAPA